MLAQRTITIILPEDEDLRATLLAFRRVQQTLSPICYNNGKPLSALALHSAAYHTVKGTLNAQMTCSAIRPTAGAYTCARSGGRPAQRPFTFRSPRALFLVGTRGRDAEFRQDGTVSIWTVAGRKHLSYTVPPAFQERLSQAVEIDCLTVVERDGRLLARVTLSLQAPEPVGTTPVGIDLNETNALVAVDSEGQELFISGRTAKIANKRTRKTRSRLQTKLAARKAEKKDTHSVRRILKRLGRKQRNRTRTFAQTVARELIDWAPQRAILVFEALQMPEPERGKVHGRALRRRLTHWPHRLIVEAARNRAELVGVAIATVNPAYTSQTCSRCGLPGRRKRHDFSCPHCGHRAHADVNAAVNIRNRYAVSRHGGPPSVGPEALA